MDSVSAAITQSLVRLIGGESVSFKSLFAGEPRIDTSLHGEIRGRRAFARFIDEQRRLLREERVQRGSGTPLPRESDFGSGSSPGCTAL